MNIAVFGTGYVGLVTGACLANLGHKVHCVDIDERKIKQLQEGIISFFEPGLVELVAKNVNRGRLLFTADAQSAIQSAEAIFNCVGTPSQESGSADLRHVFAVAQTVARTAQGYKLLINKSTVPPGTAQQCASLIQETNPSSEVEVASNPEFLAEGKAVHDFTHPDKIVFGAKTMKAYALLRRIYTGRARTYIPILETDWETAEMIKYANNSFLAAKISFVNELANICERVGADVKMVTQAMGLDYRINPRFLNPGIGYGGSCFPKDVRALIHTAKEKGYDAALLREVDLLNERQKKKLLLKVKDRFGLALHGHRFTIWGASFKPQTSDIRESPALVLIKELLEHGAEVSVFDPVAQGEVRNVFGTTLQYASSLAESVVGSSAVILATEWDEFRNVNFAELGRTMKHKIVFDGRNIYEPEMVKEDGFEYVGVGRK
ncbi:UDP-glucose/GDP-mannose dehydrogenase family protein [Candidatus Woesearchaeota archaeon]|nr:UDP-glucose/GDP-mannose dehydrogenase family protein [Candidatus Woesearchaeota archaeon]